MAAELLGDPGGAQPLPAQGDDAGAQDPIAWGVAASGKLMDLALFIGIFGRASGEQLRHDPLLPRQAVRSQAYVYRL
jgi:hypothetical protein